MTLVIRSADPVKDAADLARMGYAFFSMTPYSKVTKFSEDSMLCFVKTILDSGSGSVFVAEKDGRVIGATAGIISPLWMNMDYKVAIEVFWWVDDSERKGCVGITLMKTLEDWARKNGVQMLSMSAIETIQIDRISKLYKHFGYEPSERTYSKEM